MSNNSNPFDDDFLKNFGAQDANKENSDSHDEISENLSFDFNFSEESATEPISETVSEISEFNFGADSEITPEIVDEIPSETTMEMAKEVSFEAFSQDFVEETPEVKTEVTPEAPVAEDFLNFLNQTPANNEEPQVETENYAFNFMQTEESDPETAPAEVVTENV
ncbi:MAG: hypothetical protein Q4C70_09120, partial [Planctomycetia bacterium]|nr:hypothetical protein [Planctomycetia bacterium]